MKRLIIVAVLLLIIAGAAIFGLRALIQSSPDDRARAVLETVLRDPESAQLRNVREVANGGICGEVNARNGFGGLTGFEQFYVIGGSAFLQSEESLPGTIASFCEKKDT